MAQKKGPFERVERPKFREETPRKGYERRMGILTHASDILRCNERISTPVGYLRQFDGLFDIPNAPCNLLKPFIVASRPQGQKICVPPAGIRQESPLGIRFVAAHIVIEQFFSTDGLTASQQRRQ